MEAERADQIKEAAARALATLEHHDGGEQRATGRVLVR
jgi:hypothetical protein